MLFGSGVLMLPLIFKRNPHADVVTKNAHLVSIYFMPGLVSSKNNFEITFKEFNKKFIASGLSDVDQTLLTHNEAPGSLFQFSVNQGDFQSRAESVKLFTLSSANNIYLADDNERELAEQSRWFAAAIFFATFILGGFLAFKMRKRYFSGADSKTADIDSLMIWSVLNPLPAGALSFASFFFFVGILSSQWAFALIASLSGFGVYYYWQKKFFSSNAWIHSILARNQESITKLALRPNTGGSPKHVRAVEILLKSGAKLDAKNAAGQTPLHITAGSGNVEAVALLLKNGATADIPDAMGDTALMIATRKGFLQIVVKLLEAGANIHHTNRAQETSIGLAAALKNPAVADQLKRADALAKAANEKKKRLEEEEEARKRAQA